MTEPAGGPLASVGYWLHHSALAWRREMDSRLRPLGLTHTQFDLLGSISWLSRNQGRPTQQAAADFAGIDRMMTSKIVKTLHQRGLIAREPHETDARANRLQLTPAGRAAVTASTAIARAIDAEMFGTLADPAALRSSLTQIVNRSSAES